MITRRRALTLIAAATLSKPALAGDAMPRITWQGIALGADVRITLLGEKALAEQALAAARHEIARMEALFSLFKPDSALAKLNATGRLWPLPADFSTLMALIDQVHRATNGAFDPTIQPLWLALARGVNGDDARAQTRHLIGWEKLGRAPHLALKPGMALTFNGIAQGYATDAVAACVAKHGFAHHLIDIGEMRAGEGSWQVGLEDPDLGLFSTLTLSRTAMATSNPRALTFAGGEGHILGPGGEAAQWSSVSVEADNAALADAASTGFCLMPIAAIRAAKSAMPGVRSITLVNARGEVATL